MKTPRSPLVVLQDGGDRGARFAVLALALVAAGLLVASFFVPWWHFRLYAPQYPGGLYLTISLTGAGGDVREIDILNHYIGMRHLGDAAPLERRFAAGGVALVAAAVVALTLVAGKKLSRWVFVPAAAFPSIFVLDTLYWLYAFGHGLDPKAPIELQPFTPQLFGNGQIGQFATFAQPHAGFWLAVAAAGLMIAAAVVRGRVCDGCEQRGTCAATCPRLFVGPAVARRPGSPTTKATTATTADAAPPRPRSAA